MEIRLTQKDADFILNYLRADLQRINNKCDRVIENEKTIARIKMDIDERGSPFEKAYAEMFQNAIKVSVQEYDALYKQLSGVIIKCIELLTTGSQTDE